MGKGADCSTMWRAFAHMNPRQQRGSVQEKRPAEKHGPKITFQSKDSRDTIEWRVKSKSRRDRAVTVHEAARMSQNIFL